MNWHAVGVKPSRPNICNSNLPCSKERLLITVKTYPTLSRKYGETVCTAALRPDCTWVRI
jgi:hypothetical protein